MSNSSNDIQQLTNRLLAALNSNYEVIDATAVLLVISQLEQTTITKEQLEATRLGKYINLLRRRTWSESLARRAKNLLKKWRNMLISLPDVITTHRLSGVGGQQQHQQHQQHQQQQQQNQIQNQTQSENQSMLNHHQLHHVSLSQPTSPSSDNQKLSRHYPGQLRNIENSSLPEYPCSGSGSSSIIKNVPSTSRTQHQQNLSSLSNGGHQQTQGGTHRIHSVKSIFSKTTSKSPQLNQTIKTQPTSFANLIESQLHPPGDGGGGGGGGGSGGGGGGGGGANQNIICPSAGPSSYLVDDNRSQSPLTLPRIPRIPRDRQSSPMIIEHSVSPLNLDQNSNQSREGSLAPSSSIGIGIGPSAVMNNNTISSCSRLLNGDYAATSIDLHDSNSNSNIVGNLRDSMIEVQRFLENRSSEHRKSKKHKKDKRKHKQDRLHENCLPSDEIVTTKSTGRTDQIPLLSDETQICGSNTFPIQEALSLSNSSLSRFPSTSTNITITAPSNRGLNQNAGKDESDLTFAGKFKKTSPSASSLLQVPIAPDVVDGLIGDADGGNMERLNDVTNSNLTGNSKSVTTNYPTVINQAKKSRRTDGCNSSSVVVIESRSCSPFTPIRGNSNDSTSSSSHNSAHDLIEVNHDMQGANFNQTRPITTNVLPIQQHQHQNQHQNQHQHQQQQQHQKIPQVLLKSTISAISKAQDALVPKENKIPKRRGRKKGSKGADAMLAQFNNQLFEGSKLLSLASLSSSKKVKTTKELLADIQNRKLESTVSSPTLAFQSRPPSTSSEPSLHSASTSDACSTNATISTVARSTPDKNIVLVAPFRPSGVDEDSGSNMSGSGLVSKRIPPAGVFDGDVKLHHHSSKAEEITTSIEEDIQRLMSSLPSVKREEIDWGMGEDIICTCTIKEIEPQPQPDGVMVEKDEDDDEGDGGGRNIKDVPEFKFQIIKSPSNELRPILKQDGGISVKIRRSPSPNKEKISQNPVKSIFDLDYDEENDPLRGFVEAAKTVKVESSLAPADDGKFSAHPEDRHEKIISVSLPTQLPKNETLALPNEVQSVGTIGAPFEVDQPQLGINQNFPHFELIEDPDCPAKQKFEIQTNCITKFHVHSIHNRFIPGVNGNWDQSNFTEDILDKGNQLTEDGLFERVVPQYNFLVMDRIPKDLSHLHFMKNYHRIKQLKQLKRSKMKRKLSGSLRNSTEELELKQLKKECPTNNVEEKDDIAMSVKKELDDGFDSNMNLSNCSDKAAANSSLGKSVEIGDDRIDLLGVIGDNIEETTTPQSNSNQNSHGGSRRSSSCSNSSINLSNTLSCSNNGIKPNITVSHNISNNIEESGDNSIEDNCSEYREDCDDDDEECHYYDDDDDDEDEDYEEDHGKFQVQVVEPESTWSTSTVGNKLVLTLKKTPISLSFKCTDKAGTSRNKRDNDGELEVREVTDSNGNEMAVATSDTVDSLNHNIENSGGTANITTTTTTTAAAAAVATTTTTSAPTTTIITTTTISVKQENLSSELRDSKDIKINQKNFGEFQDIIEIKEEDFPRSSSSIDDHCDEHNDFDDTIGICSSPGKNQKHQINENNKNLIKNDMSHQFNDESSSESILNHIKNDENEYHENFDNNEIENNYEINDDHPNLPEDNNELLSSFNNLNDSNRTGVRTDSNTGKPQQFKEWHEVLQVRSYNDELLTILPYVVID